MSDEPEFAIWQVTRVLGERDLTGWLVLETGNPHLHHAVEVAAFEGGLELQRVDVAGLLPVEGRFKHRAHLA